VERQRVIFLVLVIAWTIFRLVRYLRMSAARRPPPAVPASDGSPVPPPAGSAAAPTMTAGSPIEPAATGGAGLARNLVTAAVFIAGGAVIWSLLFLVPAFENVPTLLRLTAGVLATLYLIQLARGAATRLIGAGQRGGAQDNNPIK
jgi:hypothetical protein